MTPPADDSARLYLAVGAVLLAILAWSGSVLAGGFAYDDREAIFDNPVVNGEARWVTAFRQDYWHHLGDAGHYRPASTLTLRLDYALWGESPAGYHLTNLLLHTLVVALLGQVLLRTPGSGSFAFLGLMVFAVHPALADSVAWISGRTSMLSALGGVIALLSVLVVKRMPLVLVGVTLGLLLGLLGKEDAIVFALPVLLLAWSRSRALAIACLFSIASALGVYLVLRAGALGSALPSAPHAPLAAVSFFERLVYAGRGLLEGARLVVWPVAHPPTYRQAPGFFPGDAPALWAVLGWLPWLALLGGGLWLWRRGGRTGGARARLVGASMALAALVLLPVLQLVPAGVVFAPRFLYLPLLFGAAAMGAVLKRLPAVMVGVIVAVLVVGAFVRSNVYADRASYNRETLRHVPRDAGAFNDLGIALEENGDRQGARTAWLSATRVRPGFSRAWSNLGRLALENGDLEAAERYFQRAVAVGERNPVARCNLGSLYFRQERYQESALVYRQAAILAPGMPAAWRGLGLALWQAGDLSGAEDALRRALDLVPEDPRTRSLLDSVLGAAEER